MIFIISFSAFITILFIQSYIIKRMNKNIDSVVVNFTTDFFRNRNGSFWKNGPYDFGRGYQTTISLLKDIHIQALNNYKNKSLSLNIHSLLLKKVINTISFNKDDFPKFGRRTNPSSLFSFLCDKNWIVTKSMIIRPNFIDVAYYESSICHVKIPWYKSIFIEKDHILNKKNRKLHEKAIEFSRFIGYDVEINEPFIYALASDMP